jgi:serine phosphatase RsbU (regulator of sigma subunit)
MTVTVAASPGDPDAPPPGDATPRRRRPQWASVVVLAAGLALTGVLAWGTYVIHDHNEDRLLNLQLRQAGSVVSEAIPSIQIPLASAADIAVATSGDPTQFRTFMGPFLGPKGRFVSASLWRVGAGAPAQVAVAGAAPRLAASSPAADALLRGAQRSRVLTVQGLLGTSQPRIAYASAPTTAPSPWVVYAEAAVPANRKLKVTRNSAFSELTYALYLGRTTKAADLLGSSSSVLPVPGRTAMLSVPFGTSAITLVGAPNGELGGTLLARLTWIVGSVGVALSVVAATVAGHLVRRRKRAEELADENRRLYSEQRSIAQVLQHSLMPQAVPSIAGVETGFRYIAGTRGVDIGGDWYDVVPLDESRFIFVLGDVSGRGIEAATVMARLHFAIRAYIVQGDAPEEILGKLGRLLDLERDGSFATILCVLVDVGRHEITVVNAGHPPLLLVNGKAAEFVRTEVFPPVGVRESTSYEAVSLTVPSGATIMAFTDGLVERRGESIDRGLERLRALTAERPLALDDLLTKVVDEATTGGCDDDTAILAVRWNH